MNFCREPKINDFNKGPLKEKFKLLPYLCHDL